MQGGRGMTEAASGWRRRGEGRGGGRGGGKGRGDEVRRTGR